MQTTRMIVVLLAVTGLILPGLASAMNKAELIEAIANEARLTKVDAGNALNAFISQTSRALKKGDRIALVGFGSFSVSKRATSTDGCDNTVEVEFIAGAEFRHGENPLYDGGSKAGENPLYVNFSNSFDDGTIAAYGWTEGLFKGGDKILVFDTLGGIIQPDILDQGTVDGVIVVDADGSEVVVDYGEGDEVVGLLLRGIEKTDIKRGMVIAKPASMDCPDEDAIVRDEALVARMAEEAQLDEHAALLAYHALLDTIVAVVNSGEEVDIEDFGAFYEGHEVEVLAPEPAQRGARTGRNPQTGKEIKIAARGLDDKDMARIISMVETVAQTGRDPKSDEGIETTAKKVAKFKAGKALADTVK